LEFSNKYILGFAVLLCLVCSVAVSSLSVGLRDRQDVNRLLDQRLNVLSVAGIVEPGQKLPKEEVDRYFEQIQELVIDRRTGELVADDKLKDVDPVKLAKDPDNSEPTPDALRRGTQVQALPHLLKLYRVDVAGHEGWVMPIWGNGLWSTLYGYLALSPDTQTVMGITYYEHGETPGLGGEVDNPAWKAQWVGKDAYDDEGQPRVTVVKAGTVTDAGYQVDGMSGATITSNGVSAMIELWLGEHGYGKFLRTVAGRS
jgi:Na+-transporting NADH:ubiquinone oxidoreductase subunit C